MPDLIAALAGRGAALPTDANQIIALDRTDRIWLVEEAHADVFTLRLSGGLPIGVRRTFFSAPPGDILVGAEPGAGGSGRGMFAVGSPGCVLRELGLAELLELGTGTPLADDVERLLRRWIRHVSLALGSREIMPRSSRALAGAGRTEATEGGVFHPSLNTVWVKVLSGDPAFMGRTDFPPPDPDLPFPLIKQAWLAVRNPTVLDYSETWPKAEGGDLGAALAWFGSFALRCAAANTWKAEAAERIRISRRQEVQRRLSERGVSRLASVFGRSRALPAAAGPDTGPLLAACSLVARTMGMEARSSHAGSADPGSTESLDDIARASGFRTREVALKGDWWKTEAGPLLVFRATDGQPLAALPRAWRRYSLVNPVDGTAKHIGQAEADRLSGLARVFYRPLPSRPLRGRDLLALGLCGSGGDLAAAAAAGLAGALLSLLAPILAGRLFDSVIPEAETILLVQAAVALGVGAIAGLLFDLTRGIRLLRAEERLDGGVQAALWDRLLSLPVGFFANFTAGDLAERTLGVSAIRSLLSGAAVSSLLAGFLSLTNLVLLFHYDSGLAFRAGLLAFAGLVAALAVGWPMVREDGRTRDLEGRSLGVGLQLVSGVTKLRTAGAEDGAFAHWAEGFADQKRSAHRAGLLANGLSVFHAAYPIVCQLLLYVWAAPRLGDRLSVGSFLAFAAAFAILQSALLQLAQAAVASLGVFPIYRRMRPIMEAVPESDAGKHPPGVLSGRIEANHLRFRYGTDGPLVLRDVSILAKPGEFVAVVGASGSGKSTLIRLLLGFAAPDSGAVYYDGQDLAALDALAVRRQIGVVLQNDRPLGGDIRSAILGSSGADEVAAWEAARLVGLEEDIRELPMGMTTILPAGGGTLSGGQRQRLAIARAIVRKPRLLLFDEATSALDNLAQATVARSLENLQATRLVIAHRLSTIAKADRIYVLDNGEVVEDGSYEGLAAAGGRFAEMLRCQTI